MKGIILTRFPSEPLAPRGIVLDRRATRTAPTVVEHQWRWADDPTMKPEKLGSHKVGTSLSVPFPFDVTTRQIIVSTIGITEKGVRSETVTENAVQTVFPSAPTFVSAIFDTVGLDIDLVFAKNSDGTGNIQVEYKKTTESVYLTHATEFAHSATTGSITIAQEADPVTYQLRLKQVDISGYSAVLEVTVSGSGGDDPPSDLSALVSQLDVCEWEVALNWTAGSGAGDYTIERKQGSGSWIVIDPSFVGTGPATYTYFGNHSTSILYRFRVKQNDVDGYSNEDSVNIPRCYDPF